MSVFPFGLGLGVELVDLGLDLFKKDYEIVWKKKRKLKSKLEKEDIPLSSRHSILLIDFPPLLNTLSKIYMKTISCTSSIRNPTLARTPSLTSKLKPNKY